MAIIVEEKEQVLKVHVSPKGVRPDPVVARTGDIICWMWPKHILSSISEAGNVKVGEDEDEIFFSNRFVSRLFCSPYLKAVSEQAKNYWRAGTGIF